MALEMANESISSLHEVTPLNAGRPVQFQRNSGGVASRAGPHHGPMMYMPTSPLRNGSRLAPPATTGLGALPSATSPASRPSICGLAPSSITGSSDSSSTAPPPMKQKLS